MWPNLKVIGQDQYLLFEVLPCYKIPLVHSFSVCGRGWRGGGGRKGRRWIFKKRDRNRNETRHETACNCVGSLNMALFLVRILGTFCHCCLPLWLFVCLFVSVQFSSRWYLCAWKSPYALHTVSQKFPQRCLFVCTIFCLKQEGYFMRWVRGLYAKKKKEKRIL